MTVGIRRICKRLDTEWRLNSEDTEDYRVNPRLLTIRKTNRTVIATNLMKIDKYIFEMLKLYLEWVVEFKGRRTVKGKKIFILIF